MYQLDQWDIQSWFSLATETGLSIMSLGVPGLRSEVDEQVFTGGVTAMQAMFTSEIGADTESFIGGGKTSKVGRFSVTVNKRNKKVSAIAQFLLVSRTGADIPQEMISFSRDLVIELSEHIMNSDAYNETSLDQIEIPTVADPFIQMTERLRKKYKKIPAKNERLIQFCQDKVKSALISYEFSEALRAISQQTSLKSIQEKRKDYLNRFTTDIFNSILEDNPTVAILFGRPKKILEEISQLVHISVEKISQTAITMLRNVSNDLIEQQMSDILSTFGKADIREKKGDLRDSLQKRVLRHVLRNHPLLVLANPSLTVRSDNLNTIVEEITAKIIFEYDKGGILSKIGEKIMDTSPSGQLTGVFIRSFTGSFTLGLTDPGWLFISWMLNDLSKVHKTKMEVVIKKLEVPESQKDSILANLKAYKSEFKGKKEIVFSLQTMGDAKTLIDSLELATTRSFSYLVNNAFISKQKGLGSVPYEFARILSDIGRGAQWSYVALQIINFLCKRNWDVFSPQDNIPLATDLESAGRDKLTHTDSWSSEKKSYFWYSPQRVLEACETQQKTVISYNVKIIKQEFERALFQITELQTTLTEFFDNPLKKSPVEIAPIEFASLKPIKSKLGSKIESDFYNDVKKAYYDAIKELVKVVNPIFKARKQVLARKKKQDHLEKQIQKYKTSLSKIQPIFISVKEKIDDKLEKEQKGLFQKLEREINRAERDLSKVISEARFYAFKTSTIEEGYSIVTPLDTLTITERTLRQISLDPIVGDLFEIPHLYFATRILRRLFRSTEDHAIQMLAYGEVSNMLKDIIATTSREEESIISNLRARLSQYSQRTLYDEIIQFPLQEIKKSYFNEDPAIFQEANNFYLEIGTIPKDAHSDLSQFSKIVGEDVLATLKGNKIIISLKLPFILDTWKPGPLSSTILTYVRHQFEKNYNDFLSVLRKSLNILYPERVDVLERCIEEITQRIEKI